MRATSQCRKYYSKGGSVKKDPCWKGYESVGMKDKGGKKVPNCVPKKKMASGGKVPASKKYGDGTTYKDSEGKTHKRVSHPGTKRGDAYCARTVSQKRTDKVKARRKAWGCKGQKSVKS